MSAPFRRSIPWALLLLLAAGCSTVVTLPIVGKVLLPGCREPEIPPAPKAPKPVKAPPAQGKVQDPAKTPQTKVVKQKPTALPTATAEPTALADSIYFLTQDKGFWRIKAISPKGGNIRDVSPAGSNAWGLTRSQDAKWIGFTSDQGGSAEFWISDPSGLGLRQLSHSGDQDIKPDPLASPRGAIFPDSKSAAWVENGVLWIGGLDSRDPETLASHLPNGTVESVWPAPDGEVVAYHVRRGPWTMGIWTVPVEGRKPLQRVGTKLGNGRLAWSSNSRNFVYYDHGPVHHKLDVGDKRLTTEEDPAGWMSLGPDDGDVAILHSVPPNSKSGGLELRELWDPPKFKRHLDEGVETPVFSPDGTEIAYRSKGDLWVLELKTGYRRRLTFIGAWNPMWAQAPGKTVKVTMKAPKTSQSEAKGEGKGEGKGKKKKKKKKGK